MSGRLYHVTLMTGHVARQSRDDVSQDAIDVVAELLDGILQGAHLPLPVPGYLVNGTHFGRDLIATVWRGPWVTRVPILTTGVGLRSRSAPRLWRELHAHPEALPAPLATDVNAPPPVPWIADRIEAGALLHTDALAWTGDWARCLGWAWMDYVSARAAGADK